ncbi:hypothetical protein ACJX0J_017279, partial [Zea mays]
SGHVSILLLFLTPEDTFIASQSGYEKTFGFFGEHSDIEGKELVFSNIVIAYRILLT